MRPGKLFISAKLSLYLHAQQCMRTIVSVLCKQTCQKWPLIQSILHLSSTSFVNVLSLVYSVTWKLTLLKPWLTYVQRTLSLKIYSYPHKLLCAWCLHSFLTCHHGLKISAVVMCFISHAHHDIWDFCNHLALSWLMYDMWLLLYCLDSKTNIYSSLYSSNQSQYCSKSN